MVALVVALGASAQAQTTQSGSFEAPRTPWGDPNVGGLWNSSTVTPVERPVGQTEEFLSAEEVAATERAVLDGNARANAPSAVRTEPLPVGGNVGAYNSFWLDSRGHWEGDTLVVETTNFRTKGFLFIPGPTSQGGTNWEPTDALRVVERFTRIGPDILDYEFTVDAPNTWPTPWTGSSPWARGEGPMFEYACHEGNYGLLNILTGARVQELTQVPQ